MQITLNEGLVWLKTLKKRHEELLELRNANGHRERRFFGSSADRELIREPVYDVKTLDKLVTRVARGGQSSLVSPDRGPPASPPSPSPASLRLSLRSRARRQQDV